MGKSASLLFSIALLLRAVCAGAAGPANSVYMSAYPDAIAADGRSVTTITAEIRDSSGNLVADGTRVSFSTSLGTIEPEVNTASGVARARLTSGTVVGTATVSGWVTYGGAVGQVKVEMLVPGTVIPRASFITLSSKSYLVYDTDRMIFYASGGATFVQRGLVVTAEEVQLDVRMETLRCRCGTGGEPVVLVRDGKELRASLVFYRLSDMRGFAVAEGDNGRVQRIAFRGADLAAEPASDEFVETLFDFVDLSESPVLIKASSVTVRPKDEIHFRRAQVYADGTKVLSVPLQVLPLSGEAALTSHYLGWGTNGLRVDLPFYYSLSPTSTGSVHLRRGQQAGWGFYSANSGWSLDMVQDYASSSGAEGSFAVNRINAGDWGVHWQHSQQYDSGGRVYSYVGFPAHKDLFGMLSLTKPAGRGSLGVNLYGSRYRGQSGDFTTDLYVQSGARPVARGAANYILVGRTSYSAGNGYSGNGLGAGLQTQVYARPVSLGAATTLDTSLSFGHDWGGLRPGFSMAGNLSLLRRFGQGTGLGLVYSYNRDRFTSSDYGRHRLSASLLCLSSRRWQAHVLSTYTLDQPRSSTFADFSYHLRPTWRISLLQTLQKFGQYDYSDTEIALGKEIRDQELMLIWSKSRHKLRLELTAARF